MANSARIAGLVIDMEAKVSRIEEDLAKANKKLDTQTKRMAATAEKNMKRMANVVTGLVAGAFGAMIKSSINAADNIGKLSVRLGVGVDALSEYQLVAEKSGLSFNTLATGWQRAQRRISEAATAGRGEAVPALQELGLSAERLAKLSPEKQFEVLADAFEELDDQGRKVALAMKLFDTEGVALLQTMEHGAEGIRRVRQEARDLGISLDEDAVKAAERFNDQVTTMRLRLQGLATQAAPVFNHMIAGLGLVATVAGDVVQALEDISIQMGLIGGDESDELRILTKRWKSLSESILEVSAQRRMVVESYGEESAIAKQYTERLKQLEKEFKAVTAERDKLLGKQKQNIKVDKAAIPVLADFKGHTEAATEATKKASEAKKRATEETKRLADAEKKAAEEAERLAAEQEDLAARYLAITERLDPLLRLTNQWNDDIAVLQAQLESGTISEREFEEQVAKLTEELKENVKGLNEQAKAIDGVSKAVQGLDGLSAAFGFGNSLNEGIGALVHGIFGDSGSELLSQLGAGASTGANIGAQFIGAGSEDGAAIGGMIGSFFGSIGTAVGSILGGLIDGEDNPNSQIVTGSFAGRAASDDRIQSQFGDVFVRSGADGFHRIQGQVTQALSTFLDNVASLLTDEQIAQVVLPSTFNLDADDVESGEFLKPFMDAVVRVMDPAIQQFVGQFESLQQQLDALDAANFTFGQMDFDPVVEFALALERAAETSIQTQTRLGQAMLDNASNAMNSVQAMRQLGVSIQEYNQHVMATLAGIESARRSVTSTISGARDNLTFQTLGREGQFDFLARRAEAIARDIDDLGSAEDVNRAVSQITNLTNQAFGLASPEEQAALLDRFLPFLAGVEQTAQGRLEQLQATTEAEADATRQGLMEATRQGVAQGVDGVFGPGSPWDDFGRRLPPAAELIGRAADTMMQAAITPVTIQYDFGEVGIA